MNFDARLLLPPAVLCIFLLLALWHDVRSRKIPNRVILLGTLAGLALQALLPHGAGLLREPYGMAGLLPGLAGFGVGLAALLPLYAINAMGAGDVKLMGMTGSYLGALDTFGAVLCTFVAGGLLALGAALMQRSLGKVLGNVRSMLWGGILGAASGERAALAAPVATTGKLPYAAAIAAGTVSYLWLSRWGGWSMWN